jgi:hypothetical protein
LDRVTCGRKDDGILRVKRGDARTIARVPSRLPSHGGFLDADLCVGIRLPEDSGREHEECRANGERC